MADLVKEVMGISFMSVVIILYSFITVKVVNRDNYVKLVPFTYDIVCLLFIIMVVWSALPWWLGIPIVIAYNLMLSLYPKIKIPAHELQKLKERLYRTNCIMIVVFYIVLAGWIWIKSLLPL